MIKHHEIYYSECSTEQLFNLVMDIEKYPEFIPWCAKARILDKPAENIYIAELFVKFSRFSKHYTSRVEALPPKTPNGDCQIVTTEIAGPFNTLHSVWKFEYDKKLKKSKIDFYIEFEFSSKILQSMIGEVFKNASCKMMNAFEKRAEALHKD